MKEAIKGSDGKLHRTTLFKGEDEQYAWFQGRCKCSWRGEEYEVPVGNKGMRNGAAHLAVRDIKHHEHTVGIVDVPANA